MEVEMKKVLLISLPIILISALLLTQTFAKRDPNEGLKKGKWVTNSEFIQMAADAGLTIPEDAKGQPENINKPIVLAEAARILTGSGTYPENLLIYAEEIKNYESIPPQYTEAILKGYIAGIVQTDKNGAVMYGRKISENEALNMIEIIKNPGKAPSKTRTKFRPEGRANLRGPNNEVKKESLGAKPADAATVNDVEKVYPPFAALKRNIKDIVIQNCETETINLALYQKDEETRIMQLAVNIDYRAAENSIVITAQVWNDETKKYCKDIFKALFENGDSLFTRFDGLQEGQGIRFEKDGRAIEMSNKEVVGLKNVRMITYELE
jgi:hypothetical protein